MSPTMSMKSNYILNFIKETYIIAIFDNNCLLNGYLEDSNYDYQGFLNKYDFGFCEYIKKEFNNNYQDFLDYNKICLNKLDNEGLESLLSIIKLIQNKKLESLFATKMFNRVTISKTIYFSKEKNIVIL